MFYPLHETFDVLFCYGATYVAANLKPRLAIRSELDLSHYIRLAKSRRTPVSANDPGDERNMTSKTFSRGSRELRLISLLKLRTPRQDPKSEPRGG